MLYKGYMLLKFLYQKILLGLLIDQIPAEIDNNRLPKKRHNFVHK